MNFTADAIAEIEDLLEVNRDFCKKEVGNPKGFQVCQRQTDKLKSGILIYRPDGAKGTLRFAAELISVSLMSPARYGDMQAFAETLRHQGYTRVELIDTTKGLFMSKKEAKHLMLTGSTLLVGRK